MPDEKHQKSDVGGDVNVDMQGNKTDVEFQKYMTDYEKLHLAYYAVLCGYHVVRTESETTNPVTKITTKTISDDWIPPNKGDFYTMNKDGGDYCFFRTAPLISVLTTMSKIERRTLDAQYRSVLYQTKQTLLNSIKHENNPYDIQDALRIPDVINFLGENYAITSKAEGGYGLHELVSTIVTNIVERRGQDLARAPQNALDKMRSAIGWH